MEFGIQLGNLEWQRLRDVAQAAEQLGYHTLVLPDHFLMEGPERQALPEYHGYEAMVKATVLIEATKTAQIGHLVLCNLFRHPAIAAQALMSLDTLSGGRTFIGLGTGWTETEFRMTGIPFPAIGVRLRMLDEALTVIRSLMTQETTTFAGEFYQLRDAVLYPKPVRQPHPPILLGGGGKGLLRLAAKHADVINIISDAGRPGYISLAEIGKLTDESYQGKIRFVREEAARLGRDPRAIRISNVIFTTIITDSPAATRAAAEGMAGFFRLPADAVGRSPLALIGTPEECAAELQRRKRDWDISQFIFSFSDEAVMRRLATEVFPHV
ncbi:MAG: LLM class flavin-dependent oxidoreductase [Candidatus Binatia bacterium]